ncbi:MAG: tetratricopeptide repeat protein, partial [Anaerolineales bacterium]|nr:tetratricopeptide repeat protein [Anaerolineales bacterium]
MAAEAEGAAREEAAFAGNLATYFYQTGQMDKARAELERVLGIFEQLGEKKSVATILHNLGMLAQATGEM